MSSVSDIGNRCVECDRDTSFGSGLFVNRIPAGTETSNGYLCPDCQLLECDKCGDFVLDFSAAPDGHGFWCDDCNGAA
jgi:hypothetical protein